MTVEPSDLPLGCAHRDICLGSLQTLKHKDDQIKEGQRAMQSAEDHIERLEKDLPIRTQSADLSRAWDTIKALQKADVAQRQTIDNLAGETYELRNIMRAAGMDMADVQTRVGDSLEKYRRAVNADA